MKNFVSLFVTLLVLALGAQGCGGSYVGPTIYTEYYTDYNQDNSTHYPEPSPTSPEITPCAPCCPKEPVAPSDPTPPSVAAVSTADVLLLNEVMDWNNPARPLRDTLGWEMVGSYKMISGENELALRRLVVNTNHALLWIQAMVYNTTTGQVVWAFVPGPSTHFEISNSFLLELGFCPSAGDELNIQIMTDAMQLDDNDLRVEIERITVSVGQDGPADKLTGLPPAVTVRIREHSRLKHTAVLPRRVDARSANMEVAVVELANTSAVHTNSVTEMNFIADEIPAGTSNLRLEIKGNVFPLTETWGMLIANTGTTLAELSPGEKTTYRVLADTIASVTTHIAITANGVTTVVDHTAESITVYGSGARDTNNWDFVHFSVDIDTQITASLLPVATTGQFNGRDVLRADISSMVDLTLTGAAYTLVSSNPLPVGEYHILFNGTECGTTQAAVNTLIINPFGQNTSFDLAGNTTALLTVPLYLNQNGNPGDAAYLVLEAFTDSLGRAHMLRLQGPTHTIQ